MYWVDGALTLSDDLALGFALAFAFGLAPSSGVGIPSVDRALLAPLAFGFAFALVVDLSLGGSVEVPGCVSPCASSGFHVLRAGGRFVNRPRSSLCRPIGPYNGPPCG